MAKGMVFEQGYYGFTMDRLAEATSCPKGTMYRQFRCKEDIVLALALQSLNRRVEMMERGAAYQGKSRERMVGVAEGMTLFTRLHPHDAWLVYLASGFIRQKASSQRVKAVEEVEHRVGDLIQQIVRDGILDGDLKLPGESSASETVLAFWSLLSGGYALVADRVPQNVLSMPNPHHRLWRAMHLLGDTYGWRPFFHERDWVETLVDVRRKIFPVEAQELHGAGNWYGDP